MVTLTVDKFGTFNNSTVWKYTWRTANGFSLSVISYGAIVQAIQVPDKFGIVKDVVLGFDDIESYVTLNTQHFGSTVGRCANRIGGAAFSIDGTTYHLAKNDGVNHLHGGFDKVNWKTTVDGTSVIFSHLSPDGDENYPGDLVINVTYDVFADNSYRIEYTATTTKKTVVNLTNHSYFNLAGHDAGAEALYEHKFVINADRITETDSDSIPTGRFLKVGGTPFDFRSVTRLSDFIVKDQNLFDNNFCVTTYGKKIMNFISRGVHPTSGRTLEVYSDQPGVQFYTSNSLPAPDEEALVGKNGVGYRRHGAFCFEPQNFPDAVNHANFPKAILTPGEVYTHRILYKFGIDKADEPKVVSA